MADEAIDAFVRKLNCLDGITVERVGEIKELKQQDYHGKRIYIKITDSKGFSIENKLDYGALSSRYKDKSYASRLRTKDANWLGVD